MTRNGRLLALLVGSLALVAPAQAQTGHPAKGTWLGFWGPNEADQTRLILLLDWENRELNGVLNPGPNAIALDRADIDYDTWTMVLEADLPVEGGATERWVATGTLENLGSWTNRRYSGSYSLGGETGAFTATLN
jgi:hypothetical protein